MAYSQRNRRGPQTVPVELARQLIDERDTLAERAQRAHREIDRLRAENAGVEDRIERERKLAEAAADEAEMLRERLAEARAERDELRARLESAGQAGPAEPVEPPAESVVDADLVDAMRRKIADLTNDVQRAHRRTEREVENARSAERGRLLAGLGDVLDSVERAIASDELEGPWLAGLQAIRSQLVTFIEAEGASLTGEVGEDMDPRYHEAVSTLEVPGTPRGEIVDVLRHGIRLEDGSIARAAQVVVAS